TDGAGNVASDPSRYISGLELVAGGQSYPAVAGGTNPIPMIVSHGYEIDPGGIDTLQMNLDVSSGAPSGRLGIELAMSDDVVFSIGTERTPIRVVWDVDGEDIAGHFHTGPMSVMSADFEEYVHNYPNPFRAGSETTKITYFLTSDSSVSVAIYDMLGELVWRKDIPAGETGATGTPEGTWWEMQWDGRNGRGDVVRNGVYMCKVQAGGRSALFKIAVAK
ncbi:MAG TPA: FlgD immunoglobulin-like domain containing protein, partial [Candidatus Krumholzibacterium sp.]|nr:FlgD immunoglobulin-like domain containing protein [Candidatus Krumholzibacterium sp.]